MPKQTSRRPRQARAARSRVKLNTYYSSGQPAGDKPGAFKKKSVFQGILPGWIRRVLLLVLFIGLGVLLIYSLILNPLPHIILNDTAYHQAKTYQAEAAKQLQKFINKD